MLWQILKVSFGRFYDNLGKCIWINVVWFFVSLTVILLPPATAALFWYLNQLIRYEDPDTRSFFGALRRFFFRAWGVFLIQVLVLAGLTGGIVIYMTQLVDVIGRFALVLAAVCFWMLAYFVGILGYMWTFLVYQDVGIWTAAKRAAILFALRPVVTLVVLFLSLVLIALNYPTAFLPLIFLQMALVALLWNAAVLVCLEELPE